MRGIHIRYRPNPAYSEENGTVPRLFAAIDLHRYGAEEEVTALPITYRRLEAPVGPIREVYSTRVAGLPLEKGNLHSLEKSLDLYLGALVDFGRLPQYFFRLGQRAWPIYQLREQMVVRYPGLPALSATTIGELRLELADCFMATGHIQHPDDLSILSLSTYDLQLAPPLAMIRTAGPADIPIFPETAGGTLSLVAPVNARTVRLPLTSAGDILRLQKAVADFLLEKGKIESAEEVVIRNLSPGLWQGLLSELRPLQEKLSYYEQREGTLLRQQIPIYANGSVLVAAQDQKAGGMILHVARSAGKLQSRLGSELYEAGRLPSPTYVTLARDNGLERKKDSILL